MHLLGILNVTNFVATAGYSAIFILSVLQSCCVPTSSELTLGFAGALAAQGKLSLVLVIVVGALGEVVGAYVAWVAGRYAGRAVVDRFGRYILLSHRDLDRAEAWYERHERFGVFGSRLLPVIRNFVAVPAGMAEVPLVRFGVLTAAGSLLWDGAWAGIGYGVGAHWHAIAKAFGDIGYVLGAVLVAAVVFGAVHRYRSYKAATSGAEGAAAASPAPSTRYLNNTLTAFPTTPRRTGRSRKAAAGGSVRWLSSSSGRPPGHAPRPADGAAYGTHRWIGSSSSRPVARPRRRDFPDSPIAAWEAVVRAGTTETPARDEPAVDENRDEGPAAPSPAGAARPGSPRTVPSRPVPAPDRGRSPVPGDRFVRDDGQLPLVGRIFRGPLAAKVPEVILAFWVVKILTTAGGEATSDYLRVYGNIKGGAVEVGLFLVGLVLQFGTRRYRAFAYWFLAFAVAIFGTGVSDFLHLDVGIPYAGTTLLWAIVLAGIFWLWQRSEGTLSIHSIVTQRREGFYWATVFATFALGTALGDFTAASLHLGYLGSGILFSVVILLPALLWWRFGLDSIAAFWMSYIVTRPLGASFADYISKPRNISGIDFGDAPTAIIFALAVLVLVAYLAAARPDIQEVDAPLARAWSNPSRAGAGAGAGAVEPELEAE